MRLRSNAAEYVDCQLATMRKYGSAPRMNPWLREWFIWRIMLITIKSRWLRAERPQRPDVETESRVAIEKEPE